MTPEDLARVQSAHTEALKLRPPAREEFVNQFFHAEPELKQEVLDLLSYADAAGEFLSTPVIHRFFPLDSDESRPLRVGPYELIRELGRGGEASVHLARRADDLFEKQVAVKILNSISLGREPFRRFQREIQILASLEHPYIVRLLDAGTAGDAIAYIVTEYIDGQHIDEFCRDQPLHVTVQLFLKVCEGVSAAHQHLIVHRDLKPSNILVTPDGIPKLVDFGIAIPLDRAERFTRTGLGKMTERYASPEQLQGRKEVSTVSDVYSLGAVFRELAGTAPRDLQAILAKATSAEPADRYQSVKQLQEDLERFLTGQPVMARGQAPYYRLVRFCRRHWLAVSAVALGSLALAALSVISTVEAVRATRQSDHIKALLLRGFSDAEFNPEGAAGLRQLRSVEATRLSYLDALPADLQSDAELQGQRFRSLRTLATVQGLPPALNLGDTAQARRNFEKASALGDYLLQRFPGSVAVRDVAMVHIELGTVLFEMGLREDADTQFGRAQALVSSERNDLSSRAGLEIMAQRSRVLVLRGQREEALALRREIVRARRELFRKNPQEMAWEFAGGLCSYGELLRELGRFDESSQAYAEAIPIIEKSAQESPMGLEVRWHLASQNQEFAETLLRSGKPQAAVSYLNRAIGLYREIRMREANARSNQRALAVSLAKLSARLAKSGNPKEARALIR